ncbi:sodium:proton antiporter [Craterilacuibacter sinensis]|uniref:Sodium:proton antiporter n=1 Tax=Craterilacuibacter sinensis TaxID=2686017 RepID=A0A845BSD7_9NEIS|nr:sodium:proton antiporter [Craterilacuibacter sinensis]MXR38134.1 sodium:proton antiporter [Craterilacuibacter sinensis]RQW22079.1 sodium:proton antiporter [Rhodobacteraceae bacterium CH30]
MIKTLLTAASLALLPALAQAADLDGSTLSLIWGLPFAGILLSIALFPIFAPGFWHHHFGKITAMWTVLFLVPFIAVFGFGMALSVVVHAMIAEYIPFIILLFALYTVSGGILIWGNLHGSPKLNTTILAIGTVLASIMGTTGAAMLLIRPLLKANDNRKHNVHVVVFFIFLVANVGGGLTPLGDPPLFLGFLKGVTFGWTLQHMALPVLLTSLSLLAIFFAVDSYFFAKDGVNPVDKTKDSPIKIHGKFNFFLLAGVVGGVLLSGFWKPGISFDVMGTHWELQNIVRDVLLLMIAAVSLKLTPKQVRAGNDFNWDPILEVGKLFAGIFVTIAPVIAILKAGTDGHLAPLVHMVSDSSGAPIDTMYFWMTGILSSFLDNAPTYLVFFNLAHGDAQTMMGPMADTLLAISMGAVFMGANTYIGNAPNFMVKAIAEQRGVKMPSFFGYMGWSICFLLPVFGILTLVFF